MLRGVYVHNLDITMGTAYASHRFAERSRIQQCAAFAVRRRANGSVEGLCQPTLFPLETLIFLWEKSHRDTIENFVVDRDFCLKMINFDFTMRVNDDKMIKIEESSM